MTGLSRSDHVIVVGAGLAGWRFTEAMRREGYLGALTLIGEEPVVPYDRPPLSKQVLSGKWTLDKTVLATEERLDRVDATLRLGVAATGLDVATTTVHLDDGSSVAGTHVVIATGSRARRLAFSADRCIHTLRTVDDARRLVEDLEQLTQHTIVAVIGGGFIGAEVATALRARSLRPIVLEAAVRPLVNVLGPEVSGWLESLASLAGVELRNDQRIVDVLKDGQDLRVVFADGHDLVCGAVVLGVGARANDEWLATSGLTLANGVVVDEHLVATPRVGAIGDVARFELHTPLGVELTRIEHWQVANDHASALAHWWMTDTAAATPLIPYFWSDQYGKKIQLLGHPSPDDDVVRVSGDDESERWLALYSRDGVVTGVVTLSQPRALMLAKPLLESPTSIGEALALAPWAG